MTDHYHVLPAADRDLDDQAAYLVANASLETALRFYGAASIAFGKIAGVNVPRFAERGLCVCVPSPGGKHPRHAEFAARGQKCCRADKLLTHYDRLTKLKSQNIDPRIPRLHWNELVFRIGSRDGFRLIFGPLSGRRKKADTKGGPTVHR